MKYAGRYQQSARVTDMTGSMCARACVCSFGIHIFVPHKSLSMAVSVNRPCIFRGVIVLPFFGVVYGGIRKYDNTFVVG